MRSETVASENPKTDLFDKNRIRQNRMRASRALEQHAFLFEHAMRSIADRLADVRRDFRDVLVSGARLPSLVPDFSNIIRIESFPAAGCIVADDDMLPFAANSFDLVISCMNLHGVNDFPGALAQARRVLRPGGLFLAAFPGGDTLHELRASLMEAEIGLRGGATLRVMPFVDAREAAALLQRAGFDLPVTDVETLTVTYPDALSLLHDLRSMGEGNALLQRDRRFPGKALFPAMAAIYEQRFAEKDGRIPATFRIVHMSGWKPEKGTRPWRS